MATRVHLIYETVKLPDCKNTLCDARIPTVHMFKNHRHVVSTNHRQPVRLRPIKLVTTAYMRPKLKITTRNCTHNCHHTNIESW